LSALRAPAAVPVEVRVSAGADTRRAFRLSASIGEDGVRLARAAPFEVGRPVEIRFTLPAGERLALRAEVLPAGDDEDRLEGAGGRELTFIEPSGEARAAIRDYVRARLSLPA
jgi:PilZ domain